MPYTDKEYFLKHIRQAELDNLIMGDNGQPDETKLTSAIESADDLINSYLRPVIATLPIDPMPPIIKQCSYDLAIYYLQPNIQYAEIPQRVKDSYDAAINFLKDVAGGKIDLLKTDTKESSNTTEIDYDVEDSIFDRGSF
jgi:phage gp36-like protein